MAIFRRFGLGLLFQIIGHWTMALSSRLPRASSYRFNEIFISLLLCLMLLVSSDATQQCERLKATLTYTQEEAPRDLSVVLPLVVERINMVLEGVVDVEVEWTGGDLHGQVGEHFVQCKVTRLADAVTDGSRSTGDSEMFLDDEGRNVVTQCFHVPFSILDTNECMLPNGHPMQHLCHETALCINTIGSYECLCPRIDDDTVLPETADEGFWTELANQDRDAWERSFDSTSQTSCPAMVSTHGCCPDRVHTSSSSKKGDGSSCRANFRCPRDPCNEDTSTQNTCSAKATCTRKETPLEHPDYECHCPEGTMGNGRKCRMGDAKPEPKVKFDGTTPTELTVKNNYYCDCTKPVVDACDGFSPCKGKHQICTVGAGNQPACACKAGYVLHEKYGCVDESPPVLRLKNDPNGDQILRLKQGDVYKEHAVDIQDENAEAYLRSLKIAYSQPLPSGCLTKIGEFHVNYTVATPWTSPSYVRITRRVIIEDIDECSVDRRQYQDTCPDIIPRCDTSSGAKCINTIGSYTCMCPRNTTGDGFQAGLSFGPLHSPEGFQGGTGCIDTGAPVIQLLGPNPKVFRICECSGIIGIMGERGEKDVELKNSQQSHYSSNIKNLIKSTAGAELCATHLNPNPKASDCVMAYDVTFKGRVDLSGAVKVGEPIKKSGLRWSVPYHVKDAAGNAATVWRDIVVEEVALGDVETKIRDEILQHQKAKIQIAVDRALEEDRRTRKEVNSVSIQEKRPISPSECPKCDCSGQFEESLCHATCEARIEECAIDDQSYVIKLLLFLERTLPPSAVPFVLSFAVLIVSVLSLRWTMTLIFNPQAFRRGYYDDLERERALRNAVAYHVDPVAPPPRTPFSSGETNGFFSPQNNNARFGASPGSAGRTASNNIGGVTVQSPAGDNFTDIYQSPSFANSVNTPNKQGDGVQRRSPFSHGRSSL